MSKFTAQEKLDLLKRKLTEDYNRNDEKFESANYSIDEARYGYAACVLDMIIGYGKYLDEVDKEDIHYDGRQYPK